MKRLNLSIALMVLLTFESVGQSNWDISATGIGIIRLGESISEIKSRLESNYVIEDNEKGGFDVIYHSEKIISVWPKGEDGKIGFIKITSDDFKTADGLAVGQTISEIEKIRPDFALELNEMTGEEYFAPVELQTPNEEYYDNLNLLYFKSTNGERLVDKYEFDKKSSSFRSTSYNTNGYLAYFMIYKWK